MKMYTLPLSLTFITTIGVTVGDSESNPTNKVLELISNLQQTMIAKGEASQVLYNEFSAWCTERARELGYEVNDDKARKKDLDGQIKSGKAKIQSKDLKEDHEAEDIFVAKSDMEKSAKQREQESARFKEEESELLEVISMLKRAKSVIEKELVGGASMMQVHGISTITGALNAMVQASLVSSEDVQKISEFMQTMQKSATDDAEFHLAPPAADSYSSSRKTVVSVLADLLDKADQELSRVRGQEETAIANWKLLRQSLGFEVKFSEVDKADAHHDKLEASEEKSIDEGDLGVAVKDLQADVKTLADLRRVCVSKVEEFTAMHKSRDEELKVLAQAKKLIEESVRSAASFLQISSALNTTSKSKILAVSSEASHEALERQVLHAVRGMAKKYGSSELVQLGSRITAVLRAGTLSGEDVFAKVVGMIADMINYLEQEVKDDASKKEYCDKGLAETKQKHADHTNTVEVLNVKIDRLTARSTNLKEQVAKIQNVLAEIASSQAEMDKIRKEENGAYLEEKTALERPGRAQDFTGGSAELL